MPLALSMAWAQNVLLKIFVNFYLAALWNYLKIVETRATDLARCAWHMDSVMSAYCAGVAQYVSPIKISPHGDDLLLKPAYEI